MPYLAAEIAANLAQDNKPVAGNGQLIAATLLGIATVVLLITWLDVHPFLALILGSAVLGVVAGIAPDKIVSSFTDGVGATTGTVGLLIALGAMIGGLLADTGGADSVVRTVVDRVSPGALPWALAGVAALLGLPLFFEVGVVLLVPIVLLVALRSRLPLLSIGIPALAGLSVLHGLVPPHPGPLVAIAAIKADIGLTLMLGIIVAIPTVIIAGPVFAMFISRRVHAEVPLHLLPESERAEFEPRAGVAGTGVVGEGGPQTAAAPAGPGTGIGVIDRDDDEPPPGGREPTGREPAGREPAGREPAGRGPAGREPAGRGSAGRGSGVGSEVAATRTGAPGFAPTVTTVLLPVVLMLARAIAELVLDEDNQVRKVLDVVGAPVVALLAGVLVAMFLLGVPAGFSRKQLSLSVGGALPAIAGILLIVAAGGGFKQTLVDAGVGTMVGDFAKDANLSPLLLGWLVAVGIRLATGSATVATITAAGIAAPLAGDLSSPEAALLVLAIGCGSLFFSHVNDAGFWLVKEYFGMTVGRTIATWSVMETIISVVGLIGVLILNLFV